MLYIDFTKYSDMIVDWAVLFVPKLLIAGIILFIGMKVANKLSALFTSGLKKVGIEIEIQEFLSSMIGILLKAVVVLIAASIVGIKFSALFGILAAAGFAVGLALQGFMGNFASGLTIIFFKPYSVGDWVQVSETFGKVKNIEMFSTTLITPGEKTLVVPNGMVTDNIITNFSTRGKIRLELQVGMPYGESFPRVKEIILDALKGSSYIMQDPAPVVGIETYDSHSIVVAVRPFIHPDDYWDATFEANSLIKSAFQKAGVKVAYSEGIELGDIGD